ncbi:hypothetical protein EX30DRAFT_375773 [Ascodesmis nigricans]|uniref:Rhodopsin domain-containing protein n=1 Tax=Ascodesmis nigricans TaxID=341454 RepID=A0A4S2MHI1_9PEZI|nr:hypothetical protein EX30DRAFT_375773 [Ascodesmis nigricans]
MAAPKLTLEPRLVYAVVITVLGVSFAATRLWFRYMVDKRARAKLYVGGDLLVVVAVIGSVAYFACHVSLWRILWRMRGKTWIWRELLEYRVETLQMQYWMNQAYILSLWAIKGSFVCLYANAKSAMPPRTYWFMIATTLYTILSGLVAYCLNVFSCWPIPRYWSVHLDSCTNIYYFRYLWVTSAAHLSSDLLILLMGIVVVRLATGMRRTEVIAVVFIFALGFVTIGAACVRLGVQLTFMDTFTSGAIIANSELGDRISRWVAVASMAEMNVAIVTVTIPTLRVWVRRRRTMREGLEMVCARPPSVGGLKEEERWDEETAMEGKDGKRWWRPVRVW